MTGVEARSKSQASPKITCKMSTGVWRKSPTIHLFSPVKRMRTLNRRMSFRTFCFLFVLRRSGSLCPWTESEGFSCAYCGLQIQEKFWRRGKMKEAKASRKSLLQCQNSTNLRLGACGEQAHSLMLGCHVALRGFWISCSRHWLWQWHSAVENL